MRSDKYSRVKMKLTDPEEGNIRDGDEDLAWLKELPNGGARVVERGDLLVEFDDSAQTQAAPKVSF